jgi:cellulose synthase/poly-beta-1,6-N-acetylglucosamine synthase-like glycosyltransferase
MERKLNSVLALDYPQELMEVIVVSDGSRDRTGVIASGFESRGVKLVQLSQSLGKSGALNVGIQHARNEILVLTDVRQDLDRPSLRRMIACFADRRVGVVSGDLKIRNAGSPSGGRHMGLYRRYESWIRTCMSQIDSMFGATGSYYCMRRELAVPIPEGILLDDMYLPLSAFIKGYRLILEPTALAFDEPTVLETEFPRKVRTLAGNWQILAYYPWLLGPRNRMLPHFLSHKFGRLLLPYALVVGVIASFYLPAPWWIVALSAQIGFYIMALVSKLFPQGSLVYRVTSLSRMFVVMMAADLCAGFVLAFVPAERLWRPTQLPARQD